MPRSNGSVASKDFLPRSWTDSRFLRINVSVSAIQNSDSAIWVAACLIAAAPWVKAGPLEEYRDEIRPILEKHFYECPGPETPKGKLNLATFSEYEKPSKPRRSEAVLGKNQAYEMPPEGKPELGFSSSRR